MDFKFTKEEIPIWGRDRTYFFIPLHPILLNPNTKLDPKLANEVFPQVAKEWHEDLKDFLNSPKSGLDRQTEDFYRVFIKNRPPEVITRLGEQTLDSVMGWKDGVHTDERGFAYGLSISRNGGGTINYDPSKRDDSQWTIPLDGKPNIFFNIPIEKASELALDKQGKIKVYAPHNINHYPGALFLRNWGLAYVNAAMASI